MRTVQTQKTNRKEETTGKGGLLCFVGRRNNSCGGEMGAVGGHGGSHPRREGGGDTRCLQCPATYLTILWAKCYKALFQSFAAKKP